MSSAAKSEHSLPRLRVRTLNAAPERADGDYVIYWMTMYRRAHDNYALDHAVNWSKRLGKPLLVLETLICTYPWASDRLHHFILQGMHDTEAAFAAQGITYWPFVETEPRALSGLLPQLAASACLVVGDDHPTLFIPAMLQAAADAIDVRFDAVDSNGLLPVRATDRAYPTAYAFRRMLQKTLPDFLEQRPLRQPLRHAGLKGAQVPASVAKGWPKSDLQRLQQVEALAALPLDHEVGPASFAGGSVAGAKALSKFLATKLQHYADGRSHPDDDASSELSPYLHFGHVGTHQIFWQLVQQEGWDLSRVSARTSGSREGWWGMSATGESFLDELITWRELGFGMCVHRDDYTEYSSLPDWARATLEEHAHDHRPHLYTLEQLRLGQTHDPVWNAAQQQLREEGRLHNYMRMLWGKKILQWSPTPVKALEVLIELNNRYAVDGRDPNSYSGIFWTLGRYDRPWPERPIFGKIRYMTSESTVKKLRLKRYLQRYSGKSAP